MFGDVGRSIRHDKVELGSGATDVTDLTAVAGQLSGRELSRFHSLLDKENNRRQYITRAPVIG